MSHRDKQFIINIQLSQLKCENPFIDDFYYTMFTAKYDMLLNNNVPDPYRSSFALPPGS